MGGVKKNKHLKRFLRNPMLLMICLGFLLTPLFFWPKAKIPYEVPKVQLITTWIEIMLLMGIVTLRKNLLKIFLINNPVLPSTMLFLLLAILSALTGSNPVKSYTGNPFRNDGLVTLLHLVTFVIIIHLFIKKSWIILSIKSICISNLILSTLSVLSWVVVNIFKHSHIPNWDGAIGVTFGNPNFLSGYLLVTFPFLIFLHESSGKSERRVWLTTMFLQVLAIISTQSRAGLFGLIVIFLGAMILKGRISKKTISIFLFLIFAISSLLYFDLKKVTIPHRITAESRQRIVNKAILAFKEKPILGWGWANFDKAFESVVWPIKLDHDVHVDKAHSHFLEILVTTGVLGISTYLLITAIVFINLLRTRQQLSNYLIFSLFMFALHTQTNVISISEELIFWYIVGISSKTHFLK